MRPPRAAARWLAALLCSVIVGLTVVAAVAVDDPLLESQWHLKPRSQEPAGANVRAVWPATRGAGIVIGVVDDGLQHTHPDLSPGYVPALSRDFNFSDPDPSPDTAGSCTTDADCHGTAVAGVAAARGDNGIGVSGAAPLASLAGLRLIAAPVSDAQIAAAFGHELDAIHINTNSWGPINDGQILLGPGPMARAALQNAITSGRGGKGRIFLWAAGNGLQNQDNCNFDGFANNRFVIAVGAVTDSGAQTFYSEPCAAMMVTAPSNGGSRSITTTDLVGGSGYSGSDYTSTFGGTSAATPLVAGITALMLAQNPALTWRDVQEILVRSSVRINPGDGGWTTGLRPHNDKYGFGLVDGQAAVTMAAGWTNLPPEIAVTPVTRSLNLPIPDDDPAGVTDTITIGGLPAGFAVEHVEVQFNATHPYRGELEVTLISPSGVASRLATVRPNDAGDNFPNWRFGSVRHWGEPATGVWTLRVADRGASDVGTWNSWTLRIFGSTGTSFSITGQVTSGGSGVVGVTVGLSGAATASTVTATDGNYVFGGLASGTYTVTPSKAGCTFTPPSRSVSVAGGDVTGQSFEAACAPAAEIILDNAPLGAQDATRTFTGTWCVSGSPGFFGTESLYGCGAGLDTYRFTPTMPAAAAYDVYVWWTSHVNRSTAVPIAVTSATGTTTRTFNQQAGGGAWVLHGRYSFAAGTGGSVQVSDAGGQAAADAVRFVLATASNPVPALASLAPPSGTAGGPAFTLTVNGSGFVTGSVVRWNAGDRPTTYVSPGQVTAAISAADISTAGSATVTVFTPAPGGGLSNALTFSISPAAATSCPAELIVDNLPPGAAGASGPGQVSFVGTWSTSGSSSAFGVNGSVFTNEATGTYTWQTPVLSPSQACSYQVHVWWTSHANRSTSVPATVSGQTGGAATRMFNQQTGGGAWTLHGTYTFPAGARGTVQVAGTNGQVAADAVRFVQTGAADTTPPANVSGLAVTNPATGGRLDLSWTNPASDFAGVLILRRAGSPVSDTPATGASYSAGQTVGASTVVYASTGTTTADTGLTNGAAYHYRAFAYDAARNYAAGVAGSGTPTSAAVACAAEVIVDNLPPGAAGASGPGQVSFVGTWSTSGSSSAFGVNGSVFTNEATGTYTWQTPVLSPSQACNYQVYVWWTSHANRSTSVPITVSGQTGGSATRTFNEQTGGGVWTLHGTYTFPAGALGAVQAAGTNGQVAADAVRFVLAP